MTKFLRRVIVLIFAFSTVPSILYLYKSILTFDSKYAKSDCICLETVHIKERNRAAVVQRAAPHNTDAKASGRLGQVTAADSCHPIANKNLLVILVETAPSNADQREKIRNTWESVKKHDGIDIRTLFVIGAVQNTALQNLIATEAMTHRDIVQDTSYIDAYRNLTRKSLGALRWILAKCPNPLFVIKVDDDTLVNPYNVVAFLRSARRSTLESLICRIGYGATPFRNPTHKWYASYEEYSSKDYPTYCQGMAYMIPPGLIGRLLNATSAVTLLPMEDVYITGLLRTFLNVSHYGLGNTQALTCSASIGAFMKKEWHVKTLLFLGHCKLPLLYDIFWQLVLESRRQQ